MKATLEFRVDGRALSLNPLTGAQAYEIAASGNWIYLLPEAVEEEGRLWLWERFDDLEDPLTMRSLWRIAHGIAPHLYGVEWWSAIRLAGAREVNALAFEAWTIKRHFEPDAPWVSPRRMTAAVMSWLAASCDKEVEWQQLQNQIQAPPDYAVNLPEEDGAAAGSGMQEASFHHNAPHWATTAAAQPDRSDTVPAESEAAVEVPTTPQGDPPWAGQPALTLDQFTSQAQQWAQGRRKETGAQGAPTTP